MKKNMGSLDRGLRIIIAIVFVYLFWAGLVSSVLGIVLIVLAGIFLLTSSVGSCPIYSFLGINTCSTKKVNRTE